MVTMVYQNGGGGVSEAVATLVNVRMNSERNEFQTTGFTPNPMTLVYL